MSQRSETPMSRLICFGGAKICTNAVIDGDGEQEPNYGFGE